MNLSPSNVVKFPEFAGSFIHHCEYIFCPLSQKHSLVRQADTGAAPVKQLFSEFGFQFFHLFRARKNGVTRTEMAEILTHLAFYAGWPNAWATFRMAKEVYLDDGEQEEHGGFFGQGEPNTAYSRYFTGNSYLKPLTDSENTSVFIANVTFEPGCRNNWHIHHAKSGGGQILICVDGEGWYQEEGKTAQSLKPGDVVTIPPEVKHWHGAKSDCWFSHLAVECPGEDTSNEWMEPVADEIYRDLSTMQ